MRFSRNPTTGALEIYSDEGIIVGVMATSNEPMNEVANDGGPGSGNFGHAGRPGHVGGSAKGSGGSSFRSGSKETGYTSFIQHKLFKGIASTARAAKNRNEFINKMSKAQKDALTNQYFSCGADQGKGHRFLGEYADRIYDMLHNRKGSDIRQKNKPVDGKDLSDTWTWDESKKKHFWETMGTHEIDTEIEAIIHEQGFDGVPKIVSKAEFDRITEEHPEMPTLYRTYAAPNQEMLDGYDNDLEHGFFYVDASTGGSGFGQGMYCAGVYTYGSGVKDYDELSIEDAKKPGFIKGSDGTIYNKTAFTENPSYDFTHDFIADGDFVGLWWNGTQTDIYEVKSEGGDRFLLNTRTGEKEKTDLIHLSDAAIRMKPVDLEKRKKILTDGAIVEMKHYRSLNIRRIEEDPPYFAPEGMVMVVGGPNGNPDRKYFDPSKATSFADKKPEEGQLIAVLGSNGETTNTDIFVYKDGKITFNAGRWEPWEPEPNEKWAPLEGDCEPVELDPQYSTRLMTLDPSAKIVTYEELHELRNQLRDRRQEERSKNIAEQKEQFVRDLTEKIIARNNVPEDKRDKYRELFEIHAFGYSNEDNERYDQLAKEVGETNWDGTAKENGLLGLFGRAWNNFEPVRPEYKPIPSDDGVLAAMLGYDAINAVGHGESKSYTVVLNRSKIILSEDKVDLFEG